MSAEAELAREKERRDSSLVERNEKHVGVERNEKVDELARKKKSVPLVGTESVCGLGYVDIKEELKRVVATKRLWPRNYWESGTSKDSGACSGISKTR